MSIKTLTLQLVAIAVFHLVITNANLMQPTKAGIDSTILSGFLRIRIEDGTVRVVYKKGDDYIESAIGQYNQLQGYPTHEFDPNYFRATWSNGIQLTLRENYKTISQGYVHRLNIEWADLNGVGENLQDCWDMGNFNWYGGGEVSNQPWPVQSHNFDFTPYISGYGGGSLLSPFFLSSESIYYYAYPYNPLFVAVQGTGENKTLCFKSEYTAPYRNTNGRNLTLTYDRVVVEPANMTEAWLDFIASVGKPAALPSLKVMHDPIWSTWAVYKADINQSSVIDFARDINRRGFPVSQIEIDDNWETCYGEEQFKPSTFPDPAAMVAEINSLGYDVTLWVHPFVNTDCPLYAEGDASKYFVTETDKTTTIIVSWWDGSSSGYIDVTNEAARNWWDNRLQTLKGFGIKSFKFDAGESSYLGDNSYLYVDEDLQPGYYTTAYHNFTKRYGGEVETRVAYLSQDQGGIFSRLGDRDSRWGLDNGLHSVITSTLHYGISGYSFVLADYVGGNAYGTWPDRELFIRWTELNAFLPVIQFSILPWSYDDEVTEIAANMIALHQDIGDLLEQLAQQSLEDGSPIIRPVWWISPNDVTAQTIDDQFLVGLTYLVAPIIQPGVTQRNIYIPEGTWLDMLLGGNVTGPIWLNDYPVALQEIAYFENTFS
ncbi:hypothetical protein CHUAL_004785 [Chamberlinius hualienensis]